MTLDVVFSRCVWNNKNNSEAETCKGVSRSRRRISRRRESVLCRLRETPLGFCLRVILDAFHPNLEKTTSSVLSVFWIDLCCIAGNHEYAKTESINYAQSSLKSHFLWVHILYCTHIVHILYCTHIVHIL